MVWTFGFDDGMGVTYGLMELDGDLRKIEYEDRTLDRNGAGGAFMPGDLNLGRRLKVDHIPTTVHWGGPKNRPLPDVLKGRGMVLVSDRFKNSVERLEPEIHQFFPIGAKFKKDGMHAADMYFLNICNRLDSVDRKYTTWPLRGSSFEPQDGKELVFNLDQIGNHHLWHDKHIYFGWMISDALHDAMIDSGVKGLVFHKHKTNKDFG